MMTKKIGNVEKNFAEEIANELIEKIKDGTAPWQKPWDPTKGLDLPYNFSTGRKFSGSNMLKLILQGYEDPRWMTKSQAEGLEIKLKPNQRGIDLLLLTKEYFRYKRDENNEIIRDESGKPLREHVTANKFFCKLFTVFNGSQFDGLPEFEKKPVEYDWDPIEKAENIINNFGVPVIYKRGWRPHYDRTLDAIVLPAKDQFDSDMGYYGAVFHEMAHATGHESRLNRDISGQVTEIRAKEELRAEIASMMISRELGIPHNSKNHASYVGDWIQALSRDSSEILKASSDAEKIKNFILTNTLEKTKNTEVFTIHSSQKAAPKAPYLSTEEKIFQDLKAIYAKQSSTMSGQEKSERNYEELCFEKVLKSIPPENHLEASINFYGTQIKDYEKLKEKEKNEEPNISWF